MRKTLFGLITCILVFLFAACVPLEHAETAEPTPYKTPKAVPANTLVPTPLPTSTYTSEPENLPMFTEYLSPLEDTVIIADSYGLIVGGYSNGDWLSHSQAAAYCGQTMTFYMKSLDGFIDSVESTGVNSDFGFSGGDVASGTVTMEEGITDYNDFMNLNVGLPEYDPPHEGCMLYYCPQERFPQIVKIADTSSLIPIVQDMLDEEFGAGAVAAQISDAYSVDLDGDGTRETVVNAFNNESFDYENGDYSEDYWYSIALIVKENGSVYEIDRYCGYGLYEEVDYFCVRGVLDINGDGACEVITERNGYEWRLIDVLQYDGIQLSWAFGLSYGS